MILPAITWPAPGAPEPVPHELGFDTLVMIQRRPLNPTHVYAYHVEGLEQGGGLFTMTLPDGVPRRIVDASDGLILDCEVSFDGTRILFSWKRAMDEPFGIWSVNPDGTMLSGVFGNPGLRRAIAIPSQSRWIGSAAARRRAPFSHFVRRRSTARCPRVRRIAGSAR